MKQAIFDTPDSCLKAIHDWFLTDCVQISFLNARKVPRPFLLLKKNETLPNFSTSNPAPWASLNRYPILFCCQAVESARNSWIRHSFGAWYGL